MRTTLTALTLCFNSGGSIPLHFILKRFFNQKKKENPFCWSHTLTRGHDREASWGPFKLSLLPSSLGSCQAQPTYYYFYHFIIIINYYSHHHIHHLSGAHYVSGAVLNASSGFFFTPRVFMFLHFTEQESEVRSILGFRLKSQSY